MADQAYRVWVGRKVRALVHAHHSLHSRDESVEIWWRRWRHPHSAGKPLNEIEFRRALDTYAAAEMRLGK